MNAAELPCRSTWLLSVSTKSKVPELARETPRQLAETTHRRARNSDPQFPTCPLRNSNTGEIDFRPARDKLNIPSVVMKPLGAAENLDDLLAAIIKNVF